MVMDLRIPAMVEIPVEGCKPLVYDRTSMASDIAWLRLALDHDMSLRREDFVEDDDYFKYFLVSAGLLDYACAILYGSEGSGKSLALNVLTHETLRLFPEKRGTLDYAPPKRTIYRTQLFDSYKPQSDDEADYIKFIKAYDKGDGVGLQEFSECHGLTVEQGKTAIGIFQIAGAVRLDVVPVFKRCDRLLDAQIVEKLQDDLNQTAQYEDDIPPQVLKSLLVYNRVFGCDECDKWGDKSNRTNLTKLMGRLVNRRRHYHTTFLFVYVDKNRVDQSLIWDRRTHTIFARKIEDDLCEYKIRHERSMKLHYMYLQPSQWWRIWNTHNISAVSHDVSVSLGSGKKKQKENIAEVN